MSNSSPNGVPLVSVILPANNEANLIGPCLKALLASDWGYAQPCEVIVVANGCTDDTADVARQFRMDFAQKGWRLGVLDLPDGGKLKALNEGDSTANAHIRAYLDADVIVTPPLMSQIAEALSTDEPRYASGQVKISETNNWASRAYRRIYQKVPFMTNGVPGCGLFAVNAAGRARWGLFPDIISDDTFVRLSFAPSERIGVPASYEWPIVDGWSNLVRVRRRQNIGVDEVGEKYPELLMNDDKVPFGLRSKLKLAVTDPIGFAVYTGVALFVRFTRNRATGWSRGR